MTWYPLWSYHFQNYESLPAVSAGITQFIRFPAAVDGNQIRLVFSNENGKYPVVFRNGSVACDDRKTSITWENDSEILLHPGEIKATDAIKISIKKGNLLTIGIQPEGTFTGYAGLNHDSVFQVEFQNQEGEKVFPAEISAVVRKPFNSHVYFGIRSVEVLTEEQPEVITVFGDSLVHQGYWFQALYQKYLESGETKVLLNEGISGNRVLRNANSSSTLNSIFGVAGIQRIEKDVFSRYCPQQVILAAGINDLVHPGDGCPSDELPDSAELISGLTKLCKIVKMYGSTPVLATLSPFCGYDQSWNREKEQIRQTVNTWIRRQDRVMDIDVYVRNPEKQWCLKEEYDSGDHLHFNQAAGEWIAERWLKTQ